MAPHAYANVAAMTQRSSDIHHIVPKDYLQTNGYPDRADYNQVANHQRSKV